MPLIELLPTTLYDPSSGTLFHFTPAVAGFRATLAIDRPGAAATREFLGPDAEAAWAAIRSHVAPPRSPAATANPGAGATSDLGRELVEGLTEFNDALEAGDVGRFRQTFVRKSDGARIGPVGGEGTAEPPSPPPSPSPAPTSPRAVAGRIVRAMSQVGGARNSDQRDIDDRESRLCRSTGPCYGSPYHAAVEARIEWVEARLAEFAASLVAERDAARKEAADFRREAWRLRNGLERTGADLRRLIEAARPFADDAEGIPKTFGDDRDYMGSFIRAGEWRALAGAYRAATGIGGGEGPPTIPESGIELDGSRDRVDIAGPLIDPDVPRRFRWPYPDGSGEWHYACYFPAKDRCASASGVSAEWGPPKMSGLEWLDPEPQAASTDPVVVASPPLPPGWERMPDGHLRGPDDWRVEPSSTWPGRFRLYRAWSGDPGMHHGSEAEALEQAIREIEARRGADAATPAAPASSASSLRLPPGWAESGRRGVAAYRHESGAWTYRARMDPETWYAFGPDNCAVMASGRSARWSGDRARFPDRDSAMTAAEGAIAGHEDEGHGGPVS